MFLRINDIIACRALFFIIAFYVGLWTIRIPTIKDQIQTDYLGIGFIFAIFAIGSIIAMIFASQLIRNTSCRIILIYSGSFQGLLWLPTAFIKNLEIFMIIAFIFGLCFGAFEISLNLYASNLEKRKKNQ